MKAEIDFKRLWQKFLVNRAKRLGGTVAEAAVPVSEGPMEPEEAIKMAIRERLPIKPVALLQKIGDEFGDSRVKEQMLAMLTANPPEIILASDRTLELPVVGTTPEMPSDPRKAVEEWFKLPYHDLGFEHDGVCADPGSSVISARCDYCRIITAMAAYKFEEPLSAEVEDWKRRFAALLDSVRRELPEGLRGHDLTTGVGKLRESVTAIECLLKTLETTLDHLEDNGDLVADSPLRLALDKYKAVRGVRG